MFNALNEATTAGDMNRLINEVQILKYTAFLDKYKNDLNSFKEKLPNNNNVTKNFVTINESPFEGTSLVQLSQSDNKILSKILFGLASIHEEFNLLSKEALDIFKVLILYNESTIHGLENIRDVSEIVAVVQKVYCFVKRCYRVINLMVEQLNAILLKGFYITSSSCSFPEVMNSLSDLMVKLLTLDSLFESQILKEHWFLYRRTVRNSLHNFSKYNLTFQQIRMLDLQLGYLETDILTGNIFNNLIEACRNVKFPTKNNKLLIEFNLFLNALIFELERDEQYVLYTQTLLQINALMVFTFKLFNKTDNKILKKISSLNKKASACTLYAYLLWYPEQFLLKHIPSAGKIVDEKALEANRTVQINIKSQNLPKDTFMLCSQACNWMIDIDRLRRKDPRNLTQRQLQDISNLLTNGLKFVKRIATLIKWTMNLYSDKGLSITKSALWSLCKLIEVLKGIYLAFNNNSQFFMYTNLLIGQQLSHKALTLLSSLIKNYSQEKLQKQQKSDICNALDVCFRTLQGPSTSNRILMAFLALSASGVSNETVAEIRSIIGRLSLISHFSDVLMKSCDCSILYWNYSYMLPVYFSKLINTKADLSRYYLILNAINDCTSISKTKLVTEVNEVIKLNLISPLNQIVETNLRLQMSSTDPVVSFLSLNFLKYLSVPINGTYNNIKNETEHYLSATFYNLTTVVLHNWKTYGEMRRLAHLQYGLNIVEDNLPMQTLEQGLDVLEIMRNINVFVNKYLYNLNSHVFIEESSNNKHLNSINISHVANCIRTHGIGIMNTAVNFTYQFLRDKFYIFSQFMFDEHIKSRLLKDIRFFNDNKNALNQMYPYERAEKFSFGIRKLGLNQKGQSYLDSFRKLITSIGNAMGYIRLIRSGGRRCLAEGTCYIPNLKDMSTLETILTEEKLTGVSGEASECLMHDLKNFMENFEEATEYFKLLVNVFVPVFRNKKNIHLKNFYVIIPPLTINFVEHSLTCKERLNKRNKADCAFTDDGFALGLAYINELLGQESQFNSLHWFQSVQKKIKVDRQKLQQQKSLILNDGDKLQQTLALTEKRITTLEREFQLLYYSFTSARLFFQA